MIRFADVGVAVTDAKAAAAWWQEKVGFEVDVMGEEEDGHGVRVGPPGDRFLLHLCEGYEPVDPGNTGIAFMTDEIEALVERMTSAGVEFTEPLEKTEWGASAKFADPDGNIFWLLGAPTEFIEAEDDLRA